MNQHTGNRRDPKGVPLHCFKIGQPVRDIRCGVCGGAPADDIHSLADDIADWALDVFDLHGDGPWYGNNIADLATVLAQHLTDDYLLTPRGQTQ